MNAVNSGINVALSREACEKRYRDWYGTDDIGSGSILSIAEEILRANGGEGTMQQIIDAVVNNHIVNHDLLTAMRTHCERKGVSPADLSDAEVGEIVVREVRRRVCSAINGDNTAGRLRKKPVAPTRRVWNGDRSNWFGADAGPNQEVLMLPANFAAISQADPNEEPPTERKRRGRRAPMDLRVASVESRQTAHGQAADAVLVDGKGRPVGVVSLADGPDGRVLRVEGKVDQAGTDLAAREIFRSIGATGEQQYEVRQVSVRTVQVVPLPSAAQVLAALRQKSGPPESAAAAQKEEGSHDAGETASPEPVGQDQGEGDPGVVQQQG